MRSSIESFFRDTILVHESKKHSLDPRDTGNYVDGRLVGSKYGVTGAALAAHRGVPRSSITLPVMAKLTEAEAIQLGLKGYYRVNGLDKLPWDEVMASVVDLGFNAGPKRAVMELQEMLGINPDGDAGRITRAAYERWRAKLTPAEAMGAWTAARVRFYKGLNRPEYIKGWTIRANSFLPGGAWWKANM